MLNSKFVIRVMTLVAVASVSSASLLMEDFETGPSVGSRPVGAARIKPSANSPTGRVEVVSAVDNSAGTGNGVRLLDDDPASQATLQYAFASVSALRVDMAFAPLSSSGTGNNVYHVSVAENGSTMSSHSQRFLGCRLCDDGTVDFMSASGPDSEGHALLASNNTLTVYVNDFDAQSVEYTGLDDGLYILPANSAAYWLNGSLIGFEGQGFTSLDLDETTPGGVADAAFMQLRIGMGDY